MTFPSNTLRLAALVSGLAIAAIAAPALSQDVSANAALTSDYVFRGVSQTDEGPAIQGGVDLTHGLFYAGAWASNVDFFDSTDAEIDLYAGFKPTLGAATLDLGVIYYGYVNEPSGADYANWEFKAAGSIPAGKGSLGGAVYYSPDGFGAAEESVYYEVNGAFPLTEKVTLGGALGRQTYDGPGDYTTWNLGGAYALTGSLSLDVRYHDTNEHGFGSLYDSRAVATLKAVF